MYKIIFAFYLALAVATGQLPANNPNQSSARNDNYLHLNKRQFTEVIEYLDEKLKSFRDLFTGIVGTLDIQLEMVSSSIDHNEKRVSPFEVLGDDFGRCYLKNRAIMPNLLETKKEIAACSAQATTELNPLLSAALGIRNELEAYYANEYSNNLQNCGEKNDFQSKSYTLCITNVITEANNHTEAEQAAFENLLDEAECSAKASVKKALDCSYSIKTRTFSSISEANVLIKTCLDEKNNCISCELPTCDESFDVVAGMNDNVIFNPFQARKRKANCLMLNLIPQ